MLSPKIYGDSIIKYSIPLKLHELVIKNNWFNVISYHGNITYSFMTRSISQYEITQLIEIGFKIVLIDQSLFLPTKLNDQKHEDHFKQFLRVHLEVLQ